MENKCKHCKWFVEVDENKGECRRYPPVSKPKFCSLFPIVRKDYWCGEFTSKYKKLEQQKVQELIDEFIYNHTGILTTNEEESKEFREIAEAVLKLLWSTGGFPTEEPIFDSAFEEGKYVLYFICSDCIYRTRCIKATKVTKDELTEFDYITLEEFKEKILQN